MKKPVSKIFLPAVGISILAALSCAAQGQTPGAIVPSAPPGEATGDAEQGRLIRLRYVPANVMAHWLDPKNHPRPRDGAAQAPLSDDALRLNFPLPADIERIIVVNSNQLIAVGTAEAVSELQNTVAFLDRPLRQSRILIEARLITMEIAAMKGIWADLGARAEQNPAAFNLLDAAGELQLSQQIGRREARRVALRNLFIDQGQTQTLEFGPPASGSRRWKPDFFSEMPVIPPGPEWSADPFVRPVNPSRLPAPFDQIRLQISPSLQPDGIVALDLRPVEGSDILGRSTSFVAQIVAGETLILALPAALSDSPTARAFLLLKPRPMLQMTLPSRRLPAPVFPQPVVPQSAAPFLREFRLKPAPKPKSAPLFPTPQLP